MKKLTGWFTQARRAWTYRVLVAASPILAFHGVATDEALSLYVAFAGTVLGVGMAAANTPTKTKTES